jgi:hypothetical protein
MFMAVFEFDVKPEKQAAFLRAVREKIKPYWLAHGSWAYNVYQECDADGGLTDRFIKTQVMEGEPRGFKEGSAQPEAEAQAVIDLFYSHTENVRARQVVKLV